MYPPGSTFKPVIAAAGLQTGAITTHSTAFCDGSYYLGRARFGCWQRHGDVDFFRAIAVSCDVFFYIAGQKIGPDRMSLYAKSFGLAEKDRDRYAERRYRLNSFAGMEGETLPSIRSGI